MYKRYMGIYRITNLVNHKTYIGSSTHLHRRKNEHRSELRGARHCNSYLQKSWDRYGEDAFLFEVLEYVNMPELLPTTEQIYLDKYKPEYNLAKDVVSPFMGRKLSEKSRNLISKRQLGKGNSFFGKKHTEETKKRMSEERHKRTMPERQRVLISKLFSGDGATFSKLTWDEVREIRKLYGSGEYTQKELGEMFDVHSSTINYIVLNKTWKE